MPKIRTFSRTAVINIFNHCMVKGIVINININSRLYSILSWPSCSVPTACPLSFGSGAARRICSPDHRYDDDNDNDDDDDNNDGDQDDDDGNNSNGNENYDDDDDDDDADLFHSL